MTDQRTKKGVEIYEADVVEINSSKYTIQWREELARFHVHRAESYMHYDHYKTSVADLKQAEVIGNVFENKDC